MGRRGIVATLLTVCSSTAVQAEDIFNESVRPILARKCFACHGPDAGQRKADLRFDQRVPAIEAGAIAPGQPDESELIRRVFSTDDGERMPPPDAREQLTAAEKDLLRKWIETGAEYTVHWSFVRPVQPPVPRLDEASWARNEIDRFVLARLNAEGMKPSPPADRYTLVRRLYLDLIGLPPTPEQADAFVNDRSDKAYEHLVDGLLRSPHYGERWAELWLDLARYADTNGYEKDRPRSIWPFRDWVIRALNNDMPFTEFTVAQIAGDMLPDATIDQQIATGFHRNTMLNEEGGIDPLEYRFYAMVDRVATTGTVWLGLTTGCAQCHTHKYDPITHEDYYGLMALLNNADEPDLSVPVPEIVKRRAAINEQIDALRANLPNEFPPDDGDGSEDARRQAAVSAAFEEWVAEASRGAHRWTPLRPAAVESNLPKLEVLEDTSVFASGDFTKRDVFRVRFDSETLKSVGSRITGLRLEAMPDDRLPARGPGRAFYEGRKGTFFLSEFTATQGSEPRPFSRASVAYGKYYIGSGTPTGQHVIDNDGSTGWSVAQREGETHQLVLTFERPLEPNGDLVIELLFERHFVAALGRFRIAATSADGALDAKEMSRSVEQSLTTDPSAWTETQRDAVFAHFLNVAPQLKEARKKIDALEKSLPKLPITLVMKEREPDNPRPTHRHHRGEWTNPRNRVRPRLPLLFDDGQAMPNDRLELARWLASDRNPLVGRVTVNRAWRVFFGRGLVETNGDFGTQANRPSHPQLLDWLATEFMRRGWSLKTLHRMIVTSATYRQSSRLTAELIQRDPANALYARGPRHRVRAETVRDIGLVGSGLFVDKIGGPPVFPPQLDAVNQLAWGKPKWTTSSGDDRYRRSVYTHKKRTTPFAAFAVFDGPSGENCTARRDRSNTPLQALTLLNDEMFLELARGAADRLAEQGTPREKATDLFRRFLIRPPIDSEVAAVVDFFESQKGRFAAGELDAGHVLGRKAASEQTAIAEQAAWVLVARAIMNLDETITKQ